MIDEHGRAAQLLVTVAHRPDCTFGPGFVRFEFRVDGAPFTRYFQTQAEADRALEFLRHGVDNIHVVRDGYCLDGLASGDARTPDVIDAEQWLALSVADGMRELGLAREADYRRAYAMVEAAVLRRDNRAAQGGVRASIVIKRRGARVVDAG